MAKLFDDFLLRGGGGTTISTKFFWQNDGPIGGGGWPPISRKNPLSSFEGFPVCIGRIMPQYTY